MPTNKCSAFKNANNSVLLGQIEIIRIQLHLHFLLVYHAIEIFLFWIVEMGKTKYDG